MIDFSAALPAATPLMMLGAGLLAFLSPCVLPMLPVYALYLASGSSSGDKSRPDWPLLALRSLGLSAGFILLFTLMGAGAGLIGNALKYADQSWIRLVCGLLMLLFGLWMLFDIHWTGIRVTRGRTAKERKSPRIGGFWNSFAFGLILALSWTPCMTPLLSAALVLAASAENATMLTGMAHLALFALGLCLPMLLCPVHHPAIVFLGKQPFKFRTDPYGSGGFQSTVFNQVF